MFTRNCPECNCILYYTRKYQVNKANKKGCRCNSCRNKGTNNPAYGTHINKGRIAPREQVEKIRIKHIGTKRSNNAKLNMRISNLKRLERLNIPSCIDEGANEWFEKYNQETKSNFQPKRFFELGYDADGYDEEKHIWIEYDTNYHCKPSQQKKDLVRQNNIIKHFQEQNIPLKAFLRVLAYKNEELINI